MTEADDVENKKESKEKTPQTEEDYGGTDLSSATVQLKDITIYPDRRLTAYDRGPVKAYAAKSRNGHDCFVLLCEKEFVPRTATVGKLGNIINPDLMKPIGYGTFFWPPDQSFRLGFIYERNVGAPLMKAGDEMALGLKQEVVMNAVIKPLVNVFLDMWDSELVHGCVNPFNMYKKEGAKLEGVYLGDCLSLPFSYAQPALFEPAPRAMADPIGRGYISFENDLYAFGATLAVLLRSHDHMKDFNEREIVKHKLEFGSYTTLIGKDHFTGAILELLRGLLQDDRRQRWGIEEVLTWMDGRRLSPKQGTSVLKRAARPIKFKKKNYLRPDLLAVDLTDDVEESGRLIESDELNQWLIRSVDDKDAAKALEGAIEKANETGKGIGYLEKLVCCASTALAPGLSLQYKGHCLLPEGVGAAMAKAIARKENMTPFVELFTKGILSYWLNINVDEVSNAPTLFTRFNDCRDTLKDRAPGRGLERCVYILSAEAPCMSEMLDKYYVQSPEDLILAYEDMAQREMRLPFFFDRHIIAFLAVRDYKVIGPHFIDLNSKDKYRVLTATLRIFSNIQKRSNVGKLPGLSSWLADEMKPLSEHFHDQELKKKIKKKLVKLGEGGDLSKILDLLDNVSTIETDNMGFRFAMEEYQRLRTEAHRLQASLEKGKGFGKEAGREISAIVSGLIAAVVILAFTLIYFSQDKIF